MIVGSGCRGEIVGICEASDVDILAGVDVYAIAVVVAPASQIRGEYECLPRLVHLEDHHITVGAAVECRIVCPGGGREVARCAPSYHVCEAILIDGQVPSLVESRSSDECRVEQSGVYPDALPPVVILQAEGSLRLRDKYPPGSDLLPIVEIRMRLVLDDGSGRGRDMELPVLDTEGCPLETEHYGVRVRTGADQ